MCGLPMSVVAVAVDLSGHYGVYSTIGLPDCRSAGTVLYAFARTDARLCTAVCTATKIPHLVLHVMESNFLWSPKS